MNYSYNTITNIELEISTYCNAACPQCVRNNFGGKTVNDLPLINWNLQQLQHVLSDSFVKQLKMIYFCGTYGDAMSNKHIVDMCKWLRSVNPKLKIGIHTHGGIGKPKTYQQLATLVDFIAFGIDGLADTNHLYRRNVSWEKLIKNVTEFINNNGYAIWDFIVFKHNQHQLNDAKNLSAELGFAEFNIKKTGRFFNKAHQLVESVNVLDINGNTEYLLELPDLKYTNTGYEVLKNINFKTYVQDTNIHCYWMNNNMLYVGADGNVFPCGFLHDRLYGVESQQTIDHKKILDMINEVGTENVNVFQSDLNQIVNGPWFKRIQQSWNSDRLERCALFCGEQINLLSAQNSAIKYKIDLQQPGTKNV